MAIVKGVPYWYDMDKLRLISFHMHNEVFLRISLTEIVEPKGKCEMLTFELGDVVELVV